MAGIRSVLPIVLYHYHLSPFAKRVVWYLHLRGIPYVQCLQPLTLPRPDVARLGIRYRRIPILAIGRDVYLDTRLMLQKLEHIDSASTPRLSAAYIPSPALNKEHVALERLLEALVVDGGIFMRAAQLLPLNLPLLRDPKFQADRAEFKGDTHRPSRDEILALQAEATNEIAAALALLETTLLADGRDWILATPAPSLADIEAVWPFHWLVSLPGALDPQVVSVERFPRVCAWIDRFDRAVKAAEQMNAKAKTVGGEEALTTIRNAPYHEAEKEIDVKHPVVRFHGLKKGADVLVWPTDTGARHKDAGKLVGMDGNEVVIETAVDGGQDTVRVHAPVHGFRVRPAARGQANL